MLPVSAERVLRRDFFRRGQAAAFVENGASPVKWVPCCPLYARHVSVESPEQRSRRNRRRRLLLSSDCKFSSVRLQLSSVSVSSVRIVYLTSVLIIGMNRLASAVVARLSWHP